MAINSSLASSVTRRLVTAGIIAGVALGMAATAHADTATASNATSDSLGVFNASSHPITFTGFSKGSASGPAAGTVLQPGQSTSFTISPGYPSANIADAAWVSDNGHHYTTEFSGVEWQFQGNVGESSTSSCGAGDAPCAPGSKTDLTLYLMDPAGTPTVDVPASDTATQQMILDGFCYAGAKGTCTYKLTNESLNGTPAVAASNFYPNNGVKDEVFHMAWTHTTTSTQSYTVTDSAGINIKNLITAEVKSVKFHELVDTHTESSSVDVKVPPNYTGNVTFAPNVVTDVGDFTAKIGNTTWVLHDVAYSTPDPQNFGVVDSEVKKILK